MSEPQPVPGFSGYFINENGGLFSRKTGDMKPLAGCTTGGYRVYSLQTDGGKKQTSAHRLVALTFIGPEPFPGAFVRHLDDDRSNNHVSNLAWGTIADNAADAVRNGKMSQGDNHHSSKATSEQVLAMREAYADGATLQELADEYGLSTPTVSNIVSGVTWRNVGGPTFPENMGSERTPKGERAGGAKLTEAHILRIYDMSDSGMGQKAIAKCFDMHHSTISHILSGRNWTDMYEKHDRANVKQRPHYDALLKENAELRKALGAARPTYDDALRRVEAERKRAESLRKRLDRCAEDFDEMNDRRKVAEQERDAALEIKASVERDARMYAEAAAERDDLRAEVVRLERQLICGDGGECEWPEGRQCRNHIARNANASIRNEADLAEMLEKAEAQRDRLAEALRRISFGGDLSAPQFSSDKTVRCASAALAEAGL